MADQLIALVTGANRGIGKEIVRGLAEQGNKVILTARDSAKGESVAAEFRSKGWDVIFHVLDMNSEADMERMAEFVRKEFGRLDILVNNAAISGSGSTVTVPMADFRKTFETNFFGPLRLSQWMIPLLKNSADGRIVNVSSGMGALNRVGGGDAAYRISKTALNSLTAVMAADLASSNIKVNTMCPGWVRTDMGGSAAPRSVEKGAETALWLALEKNIPSGKFFRDKKVIEW